MHQSRRTTNSVKHYQTQIHSQKSICPWYPMIIPSEPQSHISIILIYNTWTVNSTCLPSILFYHYCIITRNDIYIYSYIVIYWYIYILYMMYIRTYYGIFDKGLKVLKYPKLWALSYIPKNTTASSTLSPPSPWVRSLHCWWLWQSQRGHFPTWWVRSGRLIRGALMTKDLAWTKQKYVKYVRTACIYEL